MATEPTVELTLAEKLADELFAVAVHLRTHPHLPYVNVSRGVPHTDLQVAGFSHLAEVRGASAVLLWAKTMTSPVVKVRHHDETRAAVRVTGAVGGVVFEVWDTDGGDINRWCGPIDRLGYTEITFQQLVDYVAFGTVGVA